MYSSQLVGAFEHRLFQNGVVDDHDKAEELQHDAGSLPAPQALCLARPAVQVEIGILNPRSQIFHPAGIGELLVFERSEMNDLGRRAAGEERQEGIGIFGARDFGELDSDAFVRTLKLFNGGAPPVADRFVGLPGYQRERCILRLHAG